ncbi:MAG: hypothetical protein ABW187_10920 [Dokdonella sp.]
MSRTAWLGLGLLVSITSGFALAAPASDSTTDARLRALEKRVSELEQQSTQSPSAELERRVSALEKTIGASAPATAAVPTNTLEQRLSSLEHRSAAAPAPVVASAPGLFAPPPAPAGPPRWQDHNNWSELSIGMTWSQVKQILGVPGKVKAGVFGDVMYFPDSSGGSVEFDRDGRVAKWSEQPSE